MSISSHKRFYCHTTFAFCFEKVGSVQELSEQEQLCGNARRVEKTRVDILSLMHKKPNASVA